LSLNPDFQGAKDYIFDGLSYRFDEFEQANRANNKCQINMKKRKNYGEEMERKIVENFA